LGIFFSSIEEANLRREAFKTPNENSELGIVVAFAADAWKKGTHSDKMTVSFFR